MDAPLHLTPEILHDVIQTNSPPTSLEGRLIRGHISLLRNLGPPTARDKTIRYLASLVMGFRQLPEELVAEIFQWAGEDARCILPDFGAQYPRGYTKRAGEGLSIPISLSLVCYRWRQIALLCPIWKRLDIALDVNAAVYKRALSQARSFLARAPRSNLDIRLRHRRHRENLHAMTVIADIVAPYAPRITSLSLELDVEVTGLFLRLPANSLPTLRLLGLKIRHYCPDDFETWLLYTPHVNPGLTPMSQLAPRLSSFLLGVTCGDHGDGCDCEVSIDSSKVGCNLGQLRTLDISLIISAGMAYDMLGYVERCSLRVGIRHAPYLEDDDDNDYYEDQNPGLKAADEVESDQYEMAGAGEEEEDCLRGPKLKQQLAALPLPVLRDLTIRFSDHQDAYTYFSPLYFPGLLRLRYNASCTTAYSNDGLLRFLLRLNIRLSTLELVGIRMLGKGDLRVLLSIQPSVRTFLINNCLGSFWKALTLDDATLLPELESFIWLRFRRGHVDGLVDFVDSRLSGHDRPRKLKHVALRPMFPVNGDGWLAHRIRRWLTLGLTVTLYGNAETEVDGVAQNVEMSSSESEDSGLESEAWSDGSDDSDYRDEGNDEDDEETGTDEEMDTDDAMCSDDGIFTDKAMGLVFCGFQQL
ncbi:hypothetical protein DFH09DRAFT_1317605 [Mycena vulgaris]|nr:hypothetical protein DFH09DRAFT_1317605 [Mycena vulgaris]